MQAEKRQPNPVSTLSFQEGLMKKNLFFFYEVYMHVSKISYNILNHETGDWSCTFHHL